MKFRAALTLTLLLLVAGIVAAVVIAISVVLHRDAVAGLGAELDRARAVFFELQAYRQSLYRAEARVMSDEPRLKAVIATPDVDPQTVFDIAVELKKAAGTELFVVTDEEGRVVADAGDPGAAGQDLSANPVVQTAREKGEASGVWIHEANVYQVQARRASLGRTIIGIVIVGYPVDARVAQAFATQTSTALVLELDGRPVASAFPGAPPIAVGAEDAAVLGALPTGAEHPVEIAVGGRRFLAAAAPFPGYAGAASLRFIVLGSLDRALETGQRLIGLLAIIALLSLGAALVLSLGISAKLSRPVDDLVHFTEKVATGDLEARADVGGFRELRLLSSAMNKMVADLAASRDELFAKKRLERELEIATRIQTAILPRHLEAPGLELAARMVPASEVGGDYYDVLPAEDGAWIGIGDVAGHGLQAGLVMLMVQSTVAALSARGGETTPKQIVADLNRVLVENIRNRLESDEHVTFSILRYRRDGRVSGAGAHEYVVLVRDDSGECELIATRGPWVGVTDDIEPSIREFSFQLRPGDLMVLYSDGITESMDGAREQFQVGRLCDLVLAHRRQAPAEIRDRVLQAVGEWSQEQIDDRTIVVARYLG